MHSHISIVANGHGEYIQAVIQDQCNKMYTIDPRPKLIPWENSCRICNTQMHATNEYNRRNILKIE